MQELSQQPPAGPHGSSAPRCSEIVPPLDDIGGGHRVACIRVDEIG